MAEESNIFRSPVIASIGDTGKNYAKAWDSGFSGSRFKPSGFDFKGGKWSVGGMTSSLGLAPIGAAMGAMAGSQLENPGEGAIAGAAAGGLVGLAALPVLGMAARGVVNAGEKAGSAIWGGLTSTAEYGASKSASGAAVGKAITSAVTNPVLGRHLNAIKGFTEHLVKWDSDADALHKVKFTGLGKAMIIGSGLAKGVAGAKDELMKSHMGVSDGMISKATPNFMPAYQNNGGATGDLVFAMNKNRRG